MGYTPPVSVVLGAVATVTEYETYTKDNIIALHAGEIALTSQATGDVITASSATQLTRVAPAALGTVLTSNGAGVASSFQSQDRVSVLTDGATPALNALLGNVFTLIAAGDRTIGIPTNPTSGQKIVIRHFASGGNRTLALNTGAGGFRFGTDITALTITTSGKTDYIGAIYNATDAKFDVVAYSKGY